MAVNRSPTVFKPLACTRLTVLPDCFFITAATINGAINILSHTAFGMREVSVNSSERLRMYPSRHLTRDVITEIAGQVQQ